MPRSAKGLPPYSAAYITGTDHRRQVEAAENRRAKRKVVKGRRKLDKALCDGDETQPDDLLPADKRSRNFTDCRDKSRTSYKLPQPTRTHIERFIREWIAETQPEFGSFENLLKQGFCADLATVIDENFDGDEIKFHSCGDPVHTWVEFDGYHYDMQNPEGVRNWRDMKYFEGCPDAELED